MSKEFTKTQLMARRAAKLSRPQWEVCVEIANHHRDYLKRKSARLRMRGEEDAARHASIQVAVASRIAHHIKTVFGK